MAHLGQKRISSTFVEDAKENRMNTSLGQTLQHVPGQVVALKWRWPANRPWKDFLNSGAVNTLIS